MSVKVTPVLGVVRVLEGGELVEARPAGNSTKWLFDVEGEADKDIVIQLINFRGHEYNPELAVTTFCAKSPEFYAAAPFEVSRDGGRITLRHSVTPTEQEGVIRPAPACKYRVMIDTMHTAAR